MKLFSYMPLIMLAGTAAPVVAQTAQDGFYTNGYAELSYFINSGGDDQTLGYSEATVGYTDANSGFGFEFGVDALITDGDDEAALYGTATYQSSFGKLSLGVPRAALDAYLASVPTVGGMLAFKIGETGTTKRSIITSSYLGADDEVPLGLRYDGSFGSTNIGASYHRFDDTNVLDLAANYKLGQTTLTGALEVAAIDGDSETRYFLGAESEFGQVTAGLLYSGNFAFSDTAAVEVYAKYSPLEQLELAATALNIDTGSDSITLYGLSADYEFNQGAYVQAGVADAFEGSDDTAYNLALGLRF
jgi:hypothetical protein